MPAPIPSSPRKERQRRTKQECCGANLTLGVSMHLKSAFIIA
jgi:hypothetical protein